MRRREVILGAASWPLLASAQQQSVPVVGLLCGTRFDDREVGAVRQGLSEVVVEGKNLAIEYRSAEGQYDRLPTLAADLVSRHVPVLIAIRGTATGLAAKAATATIPVVFAVVGDPVKVGLVHSLNRPGGNVTGLAFLVTALGAKRLELLHELVPTATSVGYLANPANPNMASETSDVLAAASAMGQKVLVENASSATDIDFAFGHFARQKINAVIVAADAFFNSRRDQFVALAAHHALPVIHDLREYVVAGALMSYGTDRTDSYRLAGVYAGRILMGERPGDLPVMQSTKLKFVINLKTAKALGLTIPPTLLARADEVIE
jgi:putative ABC transport system substrate-binding protein